MLYAQPLPRNEWIVVRARSGSNTDGNGHIYSAQGNLLRTVALGDGIQDVQATDDGQIWVSYFDEGIFDDTTLAQAGLACFDQNDLVVFGFNGMNRRSIADCYALNVVNNSETWLCPYTNFPIVKLESNQINYSWDNNPIHGSHAFAIWKDKALFSGGYREHDKLYIVSLYQTDGQELLKEECHAIDESEIKFKSAFGRGSRLCLETD